MKSLLLAGMAALALGAGQASANVVSGSLYEDVASVAGDATVANTLTISPANLAATFQVSSPLNFASTAPNGYTVGGWLASAGATGIGYHNGFASGDDLDNTVMYFTGTVSVHTGDTFIAGHDDGLELIIGGNTVISEPDPTSFTTTTRTYSGPSGNLPFQLSYGECCGAPAFLEVTLPLRSVPEPASIALLGTALLGVGLIRRRA